MTARFPFQEVACVSESSPLAYCSLPWRYYESSDYTRDYLSGCVMMTDTILSSHPASGAGLSGCAWPAPYATVLPAARVVPRPPVARSVAMVP